MSKKGVEIKYHCEDCKHHYGDLEVGADGRFFLCRCEYEKWCKFLRTDWCNRFEYGKSKDSEPKE